MQNLVEILANFFNKKGVWIGQSPPIFVETLQLFEQNNYRAPERFHSSYEVVWFYEVNLFAHQMWQLFLDEMLCLLTETGHLIIRLQQNEWGNIVELKSILFRRYNKNVELIDQLTIEDSSIICIFGVQRKQIICQNAKSWTIGILTNGQKDGNVVHLINKCSTLLPHESLEFIVAGTFNPELTVCPSLVKTFDLNHEDNLPRITEKKYKIVSLANNTNVAIFHDRYAINDNFFSGFEIFGYDFDFLTINQTYEDGTFFPGYAGLGVDSFSWVSPQFDKNPGTLHRGHYINGGVMIFKKALLMGSNFNSLLLHNEAEDVELSFYLRSQGIIPRLNVFSSVKTIGIPTTYTSSFRDISFIKNPVIDTITPPTVINNPPIIPYKKFQRIIFYVWNKTPEGIKFYLNQNKLINYLKRKMRT